ncbi:MAG: DNA translocase FtsK 4TM domain-containing protein [Patescibacteria group bacterium]
MARRGRKKAIKLKMKPDTAKSILSIILIVTGGLVLVSFITPDYAINSVIQKGIRGLFGITSIFLTPVLIVWGLIYIPSIKWKFAELRVLFGLLALLIGSSGLVHTFYSREDAKSIAQDGLGGGFVGYLISKVLINTLSIYGAVLILLAFLVVTLIFIWDKPLDELMSRLPSNLGFLNKLKFKRKAKLSGEMAEDAHQDEIKISTGVAESAVEVNSHPEEAKKPAKKVVEEPSFEVIPSMAEPQAGLVVPQLPTGTEGIALTPNLPYSDRIWEPPPLDILNPPSNAPVDRGDVKARAKIIEDTLRSFGIEISVKEINYGPSVTQYALETPSGTKIAKISNLQYDLALALASPTGSVRIEAPIPGRSLIGIEVPNNNRLVVNFKEILTSDAMKGNKAPLGIVLGKDVSGASKVYDIAKMPHLLVAGATGSGKSIFLQSIMFSLLFKKGPDEVKFILVDPKRVELVYYQDIPHLLTPVVTDSEKAPSVFGWLVDEMERRYKLLEAARVRNIVGYNEKSGFQAMPYIVVIVDEMAEIMVRDPAAVEKNIIRLAQLSRATGIHLILTVQRPSTNIITGLIKANIPCRAAFNVTSQVDSRVIIDQPGAEKLLGKGDMLFVPPDASKPVRLQGSFIDEKEINQLVSYLKSTGMPPSYNAEILSKPPIDTNKSISAGGDATDDLFDDAVEVVVTAGKASASLLQRRLSIGYARAARILDELEAKGVIGPARGSKPRDVLMSDTSATDPLSDTLDTEIEDLTFDS